MDVKGNMKLFLNLLITVLTDSHSSVITQLECFQIDSFYPATALNWNIIFYTFKNFKDTLYALQTAFIDRQCPDLK